MACENKYITLLDLARQAKIITGNTACFDGKIETGIPFSGFPTGVDTATTVSLGVVSSESAVLSGNNLTTLFDVANPLSANYNAIFDQYSANTWTNSLFSAHTSGLTLPITPLSATTQIVGPIWTATQTGMTGDYVIDIQYTGYSITYSPFNVSGDLSGGTGTIYSAVTGFTSAVQENFSAGTLDYKGPLDYISSVEDASIDGRLTTNKLTVTGGASLGTLGYVLTQTGNAGEVGWEYNGSSSGTTFTGNTSGTCITDLYITNLHACSPLNINPLDEGDVFFGSTSGVTIDVINKRLGVGTSNPSYPLEVFGPTNEKISFIDSSTSPQFNISGSPTQMIRLVATEGTSGIGIGVRGESEGTFTNYGEPGDTHIRGGENSHGLNIIEAPSATHDDYIRFYAGQAANTGNTPDIHIQGVGATRGNVGINTKTPTEKLHIQDGDILVSHNQNANTTIFITNNEGDNDSKAVSNFIVSGSSLTSSVAGSIITIGPDSVPTGSFMGSYLPNSFNITTASNTLSNRLHINIGSRRGSDAQTRFFGGSDDFNSSSLLGIFYTSGLTVTDMVNTDTLRVRSGAVNNHVLTSDADGVATWQPSSGSSSGNLFSSTERSLNNTLINFSGSTGSTYTIQNPYSDDPNSLLTGSTSPPSTGGTFTGKTYTLPSGTLDDGDILNFKLKFSRGILGDLLTPPVTDDQIAATSLSNTQLQIDGDFYDDNYLVNINDAFDDDLDPIALTAGTVVGIGFMYRSDKTPVLTDAELTGTTLLNWDTLVNIDMVRIDATTLNITTNVDYKIHQPWSAFASSVVRAFDFDALHSSSNTNFTVNNMDSNSIVFNAAGWCLGENIYCDYMIIDLNKKI